jgi:cobalt/nickel transport system permease protein
MPEWLLKKDDYVPLKDKDRFIDKSILSIMNVLARLRMQSYMNLNVLGVNSLLKVISSVLLILLMAFTRKFTFILIINVYLLVLISLLSAHQIRYILRTSAAAALFTLIIFVPSFFYGNSSNGIMISLKVLASVTAVSITSSTSSLSEILSALKFFFVPDIFIFVLDITIKYIEVLGDFSLNALYSLKKRSVGKSKYKHSSLSGIIGTMFIKSKEMADELYGAMECRGFIGEYKLSKKFEFRMNDYICIIINILFVAIYFYFDRL